MTRSFRAPALAGVLLIAMAFSGGSSATPIVEPLFRPDASPTTGKAALRALARQHRMWVPGEVVVQFEDDVARNEQASVVAEGAKVTERFPEVDASLVELPSGTSVPEALQELRSDENVVHAEPNKIVFSSVIPDDPRFSDLWGMHNTGQNHRVADPPPSTASGKVD